MEKRPQFFFTTITDLLRFLVITTALLAAASASTNAQIDALPPLLYASAHALFPFMMFFLWHDEQRYGAFKMLYVAGKALCAIAFFAWYFLNHKYAALFVYLRFADMRAILSSLIFPIIAILDIITAALVAMICGFFTRIPKGHI
jgi:hypothetical protein